MNDLISRQAAIDAIHREIYKFFDICEDDEESPMTYKDMRLLELNKSITKRLKDLPALDAVPVVRCKDCAHNNLPPTAGNALCSIYYGMTEVYGFCHKGERRKKLKEAPTVQPKMGVKE